MDDREFRDQMVRLAEPVTATSNAVDAVVDRVGAKRRHRVIGVAAVVALAVAVGGVAAVRLNDTGAALQPTGSRAVTMRASSFGAAGIYLRATTTFDDDRRIVGYGVVRAGTTVQVHGSVWADVRGFDDDDPYPFTVPAGTPVSIEGPVEPRCGDPIPGEFVFTIRSVEHGQPTEDTLVASNPEAYESARADWCSQGVQVRTGNASISDGVARVQLVITNPGPDPVSVEVPDFLVGGAHWAAASTTAAPGGTTVLVLHGTGASRNGPVPWLLGGLLIDGEPFEWTGEGSWI
jgi:hypothetical protein